MEEFCELTKQNEFWIILLWQLTEVWLGKTKLVEASSVPELIFNTLKKTFRIQSKENGMFEGKEFEVKQKLGEYGEASASADVSDKGTIRVEVAAYAEVDVIAELEKHAVKTNTKLDDKVVAYLKVFLGRV